MRYWKVKCWNQQGDNKLQSTNNPIRGYVIRIFDIEARRNLVHKTIEIMPELLVPKTIRNT